jgi:hypothetical protein
MQMLKHLIVITLIAIVPASCEGAATAPIEAELRLRSRAVDGSDQLELGIDFTNSGTELWYLIWYGHETAYVDHAPKQLSYSEDLDRDPELLTCGGANAFVSPEYIPIQPNDTHRADVALKVSSARQSVADTVKNAGVARTQPRLSVGRWRIAARFAVLPEPKIPKDREGIALCEYLRETEQHIEGSLQFVVKQPDR